VLGYCLLPFTFLAAAALFVDLMHPLGVLFELFIVLWSAVSATRFFEQKEEMRD